MEELARNLKDDEALAEEMRNTLLYTNEPAFKGIVERIARFWGNRSKWMVYDVLKGKVKPSIAFVKAACVAANHHPLVRRFLTPPGAIMAPLAGPLDPSRPVEEVLTDMGLALADVVRQARQLQAVARRGRRPGQARAAATALAQGLDNLDTSFQQARAHLAGLVEQEAPPLAA